MHEFYISSRKNLHCHLKKGEHVSYILRAKVYDIFTSWTKPWKSDSCFECFVDESLICDKIIFDYTISDHTKILTVPILYFYTFSIYTLSWKSLLKAKIGTAKIPMGKSCYGKVYSRRTLFTTNCPYGVGSLPRSSPRRKSPTAKFLVMFLLLCRIDAQFASEKKCLTWGWYDIKFPWDVKQALQISN